MSQQSINTNPDLSNLLLLQDTFIPLIHTQLFHKPLPFQQALLTFEIHHISDANQKYNSMIKTLTTQLIDKKTNYQLSLRDCFQRLLQSDFLPLLRINRYELTKLSLFGFDIYVDPLEAVLQILSRLDIVKSKIIESAITLEEISSVDKALEKGWQSYICFVDEWKLSLNIYMLQEYLRVGGKSFLKKDREILFTGISNLYAQLVTSLTQKRNIKLLKELAELNNSLYQFHPSFNYFQFYTLLPVQIHLEPIFSYMIEIAEKCIRTNILTPLLFGILRHREAFLKFIQDADSPIWLPYLNALISGIAINLKFRILEYEQIIEIFEKAACRAGLLGRIRTDEIFGTLEIDWRDAKQFFISAVKIGFNSGDVQTWKTVQFESIGLRVIESIINGMLLNPNENPLLQQYLQNGQEKLKKEIQKLSENKIDGNIIKNSLYSLDKTIKSEQQIFTLIRIITLSDILQISNEYSLHFVISSILKIQFQLSQTLKLAVQRCVQKINSILCTLQNITLLKDMIIALHEKYPPNDQFSQLIPFYFVNYQPKRSLSALLKILPLQSQQTSTLFIELVSKHYIQIASTKFVKIRTFEKQLLVKSEYVSAVYQANCVLSALVSELITTKNSILIEKLIRTNPWISFSLLNFPVNENQKVSSLVSYLLQKPEYHKILQFILTHSQLNVFSEQGCDLIMLLSYPNLCQQISKKINELETVQELFPYCHLLLWILSRIKEENSLSKDLLSLYLYLLEKNTDLEMVQFIVNDITILAKHAFKDKLQIWLASLISKKIEGRGDLQRNTNKKILKCSKNGIYFINQIQKEDQRKTSTKENNKKASLKEIIHQQKQFQASIFWVIFDRLDGLGLKEIDSILSKQNLMIQQEFKNLFVPEIPNQLIALLLQNQQDSTKLNTLKFISLNSQNYAKLIEKAIQQKNGKYISQNRYTFNLNSKLKQLLTLQIELKTNLLKEMSRHLSQSQKQKIASRYFLQKSILPEFTQNIEGIQFFAIYNHSNWRILIQYITQQFTRFNLSSILLQYKEYLNIISQTNHQYQQTIKSQGQLFHQYVTLFTLKFAAIFTQSTSQQQIELKTANELSSLNMVISSLQLKEVSVKLGQLHQFMTIKNISFSNCCWIKDLIQLNQIINIHFKGDVIAPDFLHGYYLTNQAVFVKHKTQIGLILEVYYEHLKEKCPENLVYQPTQFKKLPLKDFSRNSVISCQANGMQQELKKNYQQIIQYLIQKDYVTKNDNKWELNYTKLIDQQQILAKLYKLGSIVFLLQRKQKIHIPLFLSQQIKRQKLCWEIIKEIDNTLYQQIHSLLVQQQIGNRNLYFISDNKELIPEGRQIKVNQYNRQNYCQKLILHKLGSSMFKCTEELFKGYINQKANV